MVEAEEQVEDAIVDLLQADEVIVESVGDEDLVAEHPDGAIAADAADEEVRGVVVGLDPSGEGASGGSVELGGALHGEGPVRAVVVELVAEGVKAALLGREGGGGRDGGFPLESAVHALVDGVLVGAAGLDELGGGCRA